MKNKTRILAESAVMVALAAVLGIIKIVNLPYGGSITLGSMLPVIVIAHRHGAKSGIFCGLALGVIELLLGLNALSFVTTPQSVIAVILLDYIVAFAVCSLAAAFRGIEDGGASLSLGALAVCLLRYICHVTSGATVWAGISIPTGAALVYSLIYNLTYMLPETLITVMLAYYIGSSLDLRAPSLSLRRPKVKGSHGFSFDGIISAAGLCVLLALAFSVLQNPETGTFDIVRIKLLDPRKCAHISNVALIVNCIIAALSRIAAKKCSRLSAGSLIPMYLNACASLLFCALCAARGIADAPVFILSGAAIALFAIVALATAKPSDEKNQKKP